MDNSSVIVNELRNGSYTNSDVLKFHLNENLMLLNPKEMFLRMNVTLGSKGTQDTSATGGVADASHYAAWTFDAHTAAEGMIKSVRIVSRKDGSVLEEITDYNLLLKKINHYTANTSIEEMRKLYYGADTLDVREQNTLHNRQGVPVDNITQSNKTIECFLKLSLSGILGDNAGLFPCFTCPLELQVELDPDPYKFLVTQAQLNARGELTARYAGERNQYNKAVGFSLDMPYAFNVIEGNSGAVTAVELETANHDNWAGVNKVMGTGNVTAVAANTGDSNIIEYPFYAGQKVNIRYIGQAGGNPAVDVEAVIKKVTTGSANRLKLDFHAAVNVTASGGASGAPAEYAIYIKAPDDKPVVNLTDVELVCGIVKPGEEQIKKYESAIGSGAGLGLKIQSWYDYPVNSPANALLVSNLVNCKLDRVKAILSWWQNVSDPTLMYEDSLATQNNGSIKPKNYVYKLDGLQTPSRRIDLSNFCKTREEAGWWSATAIREMVQALKECGMNVRDISNCDTDLLIGRAFTRFPNTYSLKDLQGELRIELQYTTNSANLLHHNFVCYDKTILITPSGAKVME